MVEFPKQDRVRNVLYLNDEDEEDEGGDAEIEQDQDGRKVVVSSVEFSCLIIKLLISEHIYGSERPQGGSSGHIYPE